MAPCSLTQSQLKELLHYDPDTGIFTNLVYRGPNALKNDVVGSINNRGYLTLIIKGKNYKCHRLAWFYIHGVWPKDQIDHINQIKNDNRIINLREVSNSENQQNTSFRKNNFSGYKGICWHKASNKWLAKITLNKKIFHLGIFTSLNDAIAARKHAEEQLHTHRSVA